MPAVGMSGGMSARAFGWGRSQGARDPYFSSVVLLAHGNGTNGGTTFTDSSSYARTLTSNNGASTSTTQSKFNGSAGFLDGTNDYVSAAASSAFEFTGDFTIEAWVWKSSSGASGSDALCTTDTGNFTANNGWVLELDQTSGFIFYKTSVVSVAYAAAAPNDSTWHHWAASRTGTTLKLFKDGTEVASGTVSGTCAGSTGQFGIGRNSNYVTHAFSGYWAELRITNGVGRYTGSFSVPTAPFPNF